MTLLLDTNAFIWWVSDSPKLGKRARADVANPQNAVYVSSLMLFEVMIKEAIFDVWAARQFLSLLRLEWSDPFNMAIMALANAKHMTLLTADHYILNSGYAVTEDATK